MTTNGAVETYLTVLVAGGTPSTTLSTRRAHLRRAERCLGDLTTVDGPALLAWCGRQTWATETRRGYRATLRGFYAWAVHAGLAEVNAADALPVVRAAKPTPRPASEPVYRAALTRTDTDARARLILRLAAEAGLRRAEVAGLHSRDLIEDLDGRSLRIVGKGGKQRMVPLTTNLAAEVAERAARGGYLFPGAVGGHLSPRWVGKIATRLLADEVTMHQLRHRFGTRVYGATRDMFAVQDLLGHASPVTTRTYVVVPTDTLRAAVDAAA